MTDHDTDETHVEEESIGAKTPRAPLPAGHRADPDDRYDPLVYGCPRIFAG